MDKKPLILEMTVEGDFVEPPKEPRLPLGSKLLIWSAGIASIAAAGAVALAALWLLAIMIPIALVAAAIAYGVFRYQMWRNGGSIPGRTIYWSRRR